MNTNDNGANGRGKSGNGASAAKTVMVVDDDDQICLYLERLLKTQGYQIIRCPNSTQVMDKLRQQACDCVLLDIRMPGLEGTELLPIIKRHFANLPVIMFSGFTDPSDDGYYRSLGASDFVRKPFTRELLLNTVSRAVGSAQTIPVTLTSFNLSEARDGVYRKLIITALRHTNWNQVKAASLLGISRYSLMRWLKKLNITY